MDLIIALLDSGWSELNPSVDGSHGYFINWLLIKGCAPIALMTNVLVKLYNCIAQYWLREVAKKAAPLRKNYFFISSKKI